MKITKATPEFTPITITLESQEEIDTLHAVAIYSPLHRSLMTGTKDKWESEPTLKELYDGLSTFKSRDSEMRFQKIVSNMKECV
jgi:hypothetical protein